MMACDDPAGIILVTPLTTSGNGPISVVSSGTSKATVSVCTDPNPSANEGATTISAEATKVRRSFCENQVYIWILSLVSVWRWWSCSFLRWSNVSCVLLDSIILQAKRIFLFC